jgi:hypothetical protein
MAERLRNFDEVMENDTTFDLNERLDRWRSALKNRPTISEEDIEELESHLSDTMDLLVKSGLSQAEAFLVGAHRVGHPAALEEEFGYAKPGAVWKERAQWMVLGILALWTATNLAKVATSLTLWLGGPLSGHGFALGWTGLAVQTLLILCFGGLTLRLITGHSDIASTAQPQAGRSLAGRWIICFSVGTIVLGISGTLLQAIAVRENEPGILGLYFTVTQWGTAVLLPAMVIVGGLWLARSTTLNPAGGVAAVLLAALLVGCSPSHQSADRSTAPGQAASLEFCLELINDDVNAAVEMFLSLDLEQGTLFSPGSALARSESQFVKLPASAREKIGQQALADVEPVKRLVTEVRSRRNAARAAGDTALAERYNAQLARLGERLSGPDNLELTQLVGKSVSRAAAE